MPGGHHGLDGIGQEAGDVGFLELVAELVVQHERLHLDLRVKMTNMCNTYVNQNFLQQLFPNV